MTDMNGIHFIQHKQVGARPSFVGLSALNDPKLAINMPKIAKNRYILHTTLKSSKEIVGASFWRNKNGQNRPFHTTFLKKTKKHYHQLKNKGTHHPFAEMLGTLHPLRDRLHVYKSVYESPYDSVHNWLPKSLGF
jgi:hypothetical protein